MSVKTAHSAEDSVEQARALWVAGTAAYQANDYRASIQAFDQAYALAKRPGILHSLGTAHMSIFMLEGSRSDGEKALEYLRAYLSSSDTRVRIDAENRILTVEKKLAAMVEPVDAEGEHAAAIPAEAETKVATRLMITSDVEDATVAVDGADPEPIPYFSEVDAGTHEILVTAPKSQEFKRRLTVPEGGVVALDVKLDQLPGKIAIVTEPGAEVWVDGKLATRAPLGEPLALSPGRHSVGLRKNGRKLRSDALVVESADTLTLDGRLEPSPRRTASWVSIGLGAASLVGAGVFGAATLHQQSKVSKIDELRGTGELTLDDLKQYNQSLDRRKMYRTATIVSLGAGVAFAGAGITLYLFDTPSAPAASPTGLRATASFEPGFVGGSLLRRF